MSDGGYTEVGGHVGLRGGGRRRTPLQGFGSVPAETRGAASLCPGLTKVVPLGRQDEGKWYRGDGSASKRGARGRGWRPMFRPMF